MFFTNIIVLCHWEDNTEAGDFISSASVLSLFSGTKNGLLGSRDAFFSVLLQKICMLRKKTATNLEVLWLDCILFYSAEAHVTCCLFLCVRFHHRWLYIEVASYFFTWVCLIFSTTCFTKLRRYSKQLSTCLGARRSCKLYKFCKKMWLIFFEN